MIDLTVKTLDSRNHVFSVPDDITVKQLKERIADSVNVPAESQRLIYCGRVLQDDKNLSEYDVNGKVIHLVQRAPPLPHGGGPDSGAARSSQPYSRSGTNRRRFFQTPGGRLDGGNAMYLGAMAFPADLMESQGLAMPQPRQCLSQSRLTVARQMLHRAGNTLNSLEHPNSTTDSPADGSPSPDANANVNAGDESLQRSITLAAQMASAAAFAAAITAAQGNPASEDDVRTDDVAATAAAAAAAAAPLEPVPEAEQNSAAASENPEQSQPQQPSSRTDEPQSEGNGNSGRSRYPRTTAMAGLLDTLSDVNRRLQPFLEQFHQTMREDPVLESPAETQRIFVRVSEVMHFLSHAYHALSDIMCDFAQPPPRYLRCRPVLIQHSAVVQTGIPIQAQINLTANTLNQSQMSNQSQQQANSQTSRESLDSSSVTSGSTTATSSESNGSNSSSEQSGGTAAATGAPAAAASSNGSSGSGDERGSSRTQPMQGSTRIRGSRSLNIGGPNFEFFMDVAPGSITIDSLEATVVTNSNSNNPEVNVVSGFPWGSPPPAEFIQNLMQALLDAGASRQPNTAAATTTSNTSSTAQQTPSAQQAQNPPTATANSQARGNTATHPTTSTQTRSTSRPHVHLTPATVQGIGASTFDPFLPCNSHHIRTSRRRSSQPQSSQQQSQASQQPSQNAQQAGQQNNANGAQVPLSNSGSQQARPVMNVPILNPVGDRNLPNLPGIDAAMNNFVTVVMNMANRNLGRLVTSRTNTATNTTGSGSARAEGENVTVTTQTPPIQVVPSNAFLATNVSPTTVGSIQAIGGNSRHAPTTLSMSTLSDVLLSLPDFNYREGESIFVDLFMSLAQCLTFIDIVNLGNENSQVLLRTRSRLREFLNQRLFLNEPFSPAVATRATTAMNQELRTFLENVINLRDNRLRDDIDLIATINQFNHHRFPAMMTTVLQESDESFHRTLLRQCQEYINYFFAIIQYCCLDGSQGMENIIRGFVRQMTSGIPEQLQAWTISSSVVNFRHYLASMQSVGNAANIYQFIVFRAQPPTSEPTPVPAPTEQVVPPSEPMETESPTNTDGVEEPVISATGEMTNAEPLPDVLLGSEDWHSSLPSDWVPIITRDTQRQRRQNPQPAFSDAYLSGMPSKRRKLITSSKPQGNLSQVISENMQAAVGAAGVASPGVEVGVIAQGAGSDPTLRLAYRDQIRASVRQNLQSHPDYTPDKYPNAAKYFDTK